MAVAQLKIQGFRNLNQIALELAPSFNIFYGNNGAGKTSLLEALYFLARGQSFRSNNLGHVLATDSDQLTVFASSYRFDNLPETIGIQRDRAGVMVMHHNGEPLKNRADLVRLLPVILIDAHGYRLLEAGPKHKRAYLDHAMFHVEHSFLPVWQQVRRSLQQRNALLKQGASAQQMTVWDEQLVTASVELHQMRVLYLADLLPMLQQMLQRFFSAKITLDFSYQPGWDVSGSLLLQLQRKLAMDRRLGYTSVGPQKADLAITVGDRPAQDVLSRGQQKLVVIAMQLAQGLLLRQQAKMQTHFLLDDLSSELDAEKQRLVAQLLQEIDAQTFVTGISGDELATTFADITANMFHVEHGEVVPVA